MKRKKGLKNKVLVYRLALAGVIIAILFGAIHKDRWGLTGFNHIQDILTGEDWVGWIHPIGEEVERTMETGPFDSLTECEEYSRSRIDQYFQGWEKARYYCGYACSDTDAREREENCKAIR